MLINSPQQFMGKRAQKAAGFTILELMVATSVFTVVLLVIAVGVISYTNSYFKGINSSKTQAATRSVMNALVQSIQFGKAISPLSGPGGVQGICIDNTLYSYILGQEVTDTSPQALLHQGYHGLVATTGNDCTSMVPSLPGAQTLGTGSRELLGQNMRLSDLEVTSSGNLYTIHVRVLYGDDALFVVPSGGSLPDLGDPGWASENCQGGPGSQFCAVSDLTTTVQRRLL